MIILDTNVVSELMKVDADPAVLEWMKAQPLSTLAMTAITLEEVRFGLTLMPEGKRGKGLEDAFVVLFDTLPILDFDARAANESAFYRARRTRTGRSMQIPDANIAGIALSRNFSVATRDSYAFDDTELDRIDPWSPA